MGNHVIADDSGKVTPELNFTSGQKLTLLNGTIFMGRENLVPASLLLKKGFQIVIESDHSVYEWFIRRKGISLCWLV